MQNEEQLERLKDLYDELWKDAKTLIQDMSRSIGMYRLSGVLLFIIATLTSLYAVPSSLVHILGGDNSWAYYVSFFGGIFGIVFYVSVGILLLRWYSKLRKRYTKLLQLEKDVED